MLRNPIDSLRARTFWMKASQGWRIEAHHVHLGRLIFFYRLGRYGT